MPLSKEMPTEVRDLFMPPQLRVEKMVTAINQNINFQEFYQMHITQNLFKKVQTIQKLNDFNRKQQQTMTLKQHKVKTLKMEYTKLSQEEEKLKQEIAYLSKSLKIRQTTNRVVGSTDMDRPQIVPVRHFPATVSENTTSQATPRFPKRQIATGTSSSVMEVSTLPNDLHSNNDDSGNHSMSFTDKKSYEPILNDPANFPKSTPNTTQLSTCSHTMDHQSVDVRQPHTCNGVGTETPVLQKTGSTMMGPPALASHITRLQTPIPQNGMVIGAPRSNTHLHRGTHSPLKISSVTSQNTTIKDHAVRKNCLDKTPQRTISEFFIQKKLTAKRQKLLGNVATTADRRKLSTLTATPSLHQRACDSQGSIL